MLFASTELAARIERAAARATAACTRVARERRASLETLIEPLAGAVAAYAGPESPYNKVAGVGFEGPVDPAQLTRVEQAYARNGEGVRVELASLADSSIGTLLTERGYRLIGFENVLGRALSADEPLEVAPGVEVSRSTDDELATWIDTSITGFATPDSDGIPAHESFPREALTLCMTDMARAGGYVRYLARREGKIAGAAMLGIGDGLASFSGASTLPEHRKHGVQTALVAARLRDASRAGCDLAVVTTQPGSRSQLNAQRRGFSLLYTRAILARALR